MHGEAQGQGDATHQLRAWVDYLRDLGIYDLYRSGNSVAATGLIEVEPANKASVDQRNNENLAPEADATVTADHRTQRVVVPVPPSFPPPVPASPPINRTFLEPPQMPLVSFNDLAPQPIAKVPAADRAAALLAIQQEIGDCTRCPLAYAGRRKIVFGDGSPSARLMFVGEGPGADEDAQGIPFVGKAGQLLNNMIAAMGLAREQVYIANIVKCRPPANRVPEPVEANTCSQFLLRQIDVVQPEIIVALGATAAMYLLGVKQSLSSLRGRWHVCRGAKLAVTYHPAFLLRDPRQKAEAWKDLQMVMGELGLKVPAKK
jgi:DNA polymerase